MQHALLILLGIAMVAIVIRQHLPFVTAADLTTLSELMKQVYDPVIQEQQNLTPTTWKEFADGDDQLGGQGWYFETKMGGNQEGIGSRSERDTLPEPGRQRWKQGIVLWKLIYGAFELTGPVIEAAKDNLRAFAVARTEEIEGLTRDVLKDLNRQVYGDGSAVLATCNGTFGTNTVNVVNAQYLRLNMVVDIYTPASATLLQDRQQITAITPNADGTATITFADAGLGGSGTDANPANGDKVIRSRSAAWNGSAWVGTEIEGIKKIADDGTVATTYLNISRTSFPVWKGQYLANSGTQRNLSLDLLQQLEDAVFRAAGQRPDWMRMNLGQRRKFFDLVSPDKRYMTNSIDGGYERLDYNGNQITVDIDHPFNEITALTKSSIKKYSLRKMGLLDFDGLVLRQVTNKDVWRGYIGMYGNLGCKRPNCNGRLADLVEPTAPQWVY